MSTSRAPNPPGYASGIDVPGLYGYQCLAQLIFTDDGEKLLKPGYEVSKQTEYKLKIFHWMARHFVNITTEELEAGVKRDDAISMNYLGARLYTGSRAAQNRTRAVGLWTTVSQVEIPGDATITSSVEIMRRYARVKADAYAYLCTHHLRCYEKSKSLSDLAQAFLCGEGAAKLGLFVACSHYTALTFYKLQEGNPQRTEDDISVTTRCMYMCTQADAPSLFTIMKCGNMLDGKTWAEFSAPVEESESTYACSRPGCTVTTTVRGDLKRCAGLCSITDKPAYCTKQCQREDWKRHRSQCRRPMEEDRKIQFDRLTTNEKVDVDTSQFNSVDLARARELARGSMHKYLGGDNPSPTEKAFGNFLREMEESTCGGPRTAEQFVQMVKQMHKVIDVNDLDVIYKPKTKMRESAGGQVRSTGLPVDA